MPLRTRLLLVLVGVVAVGLVVSDVVVYAQLRSFLYSRVDSELQAASYTVSGILLHQHPSSFPARRPGEGRPSSSTVPSTQPTTTATTPSLTFPTGSFPFTGPHRAGRPRDGQFPEGTIGELVGPGGQVVGTPVSFVYGGSAPPGPALPHPLPSGGRDGATFSTGSVDGNTVAYRVLARPLHVDGLTLIVAVPLTETDQTLGRLALVMVLVSLGVLIGLGALVWWIVRRGLRPLEAMAVTAGAIAGGDLGRRVAPAEDRTEVGRLGLALNAMLGEIEAAFTARAASEGRLRRFLADASHELRTPLTSIRGYAEIFDLGARDRPEDLATAMHHIREEADRMTLLVDDLLLLARLDRERPLAMEPTDLVPLVDRAVAAGRAAASGHPVTLVTPDEVGRRRRRPSAPSGRRQPAGQRPPALPGRRGGRGPGDDGARRGDDRGRRPRARGPRRRSRAHFRAVLPGRQLAGPSHRRRRPRAGHRGGHRPGARGNRRGRAERERQ